MKFLVIDDHELFCQGISSILAATRPDISVAFLPSAEQAVQEYAACSQELDLILLDLGLLGVSNAEAVVSLRNALPLVPIIILSASDDYDTLHEAISAGAMGFVPKEANSQLLNAAIDQVLNGGEYFHQLPAKAELPHNFSLLTARQKEIVRSLIEGCSNKEIARTLDISENTVRAHLRTIFQLLNTQNRTEAVQLALRSGFK